MKIRILTLLAENYEEIEVVTPLDIWRRADYSVTLASISTKLEVSGQHKLTIIADTLLNSCSSRDYDILFIPGGAGVKLIQESPLAMTFIQEFIDQNKKIVAICAAPTILTLWLGNKKATCYPSMKEMIPTWIDDAVVIDLPFITSQGAGTAHYLALEVIKLVSDEMFAQQLQEKTLFN